MPGKSHSVVSSWAFLFCAICAKFLKLDWEKADRLILIINEEGRYEQIYFGATNYVR